MIKKEAKKMLADLFTTVKRPNGDEIRAFRPEVMKEEAPEYPIYRAVSDAMRDSGMSFDFAYEIGERAADILAEAEDWEELGQEIDGALPVYTSEIMKIYLADAWMVDEADEEFGRNAGDNSERRALNGWYKAVSDMVAAIAGNLEKVIDEEETE